MKTWYTTYDNLCSGEHHARGRAQAQGGGVVSVRDEFLPQGFRLDPQRAVDFAWSFHQQREETFVPATVGETAGWLVYPVTREVDRNRYSGVDFQPIPWRYKRLEGPPDFRWYPAGR